jgi:MFS family permease
MEEAHDPYAALRHPDYRRLLAGSTLASIASTLQAASVEWEVFHRTHDNLQVGFVGLALFLPVFFLSLPAGHAADHFRRQRLLALTQLVRAGASAGLALWSFTDLPAALVYPLLLVSGSAQAFTIPSRSALVPLVVPHENLQNAVTWNSSGWQLAAVSGPLLAGGIIFAAGDRAWPCYLLGLACSAGCAALVIGIRPRPVEGGARGASLGGLLAGLRFVFRSELLLAAITLDLFAVLLGGATALLPSYTTDVLQVGPGWYGLLRAAPAVGALVMAVGMAHRPPLRRAGRTLVLAVAGFGLATVGFGLSRDPVLSFVFLAMTGALDNVSVVVRGTLVQVLTPDPMRGRVSAVNAVFIGSSNQLGDFESGLVAHYFGPVVSVVGGGVGTLLVVLAVALRWPALLRLGSLHDAAKLHDAAAYAAAPEDEKTL